MGWSSSLERSATLTRMFTTMSPHEMMVESRFAENAAMGDVTNDHQSTITVPCKERSFLDIAGGVVATLDEDG